MKDPIPNDSTSSTFVDPFHGTGVNTLPATSTYIARKKDNFFKKFFTMGNNIHLREFLLCYIVYHLFEKSLRSCHFNNANYHTIVSSSIFAKLQFHEWFGSKKKFLEALKSMSKKLSSPSFNFESIIANIEEYDISSNIEAKEENSVSHVASLSRNAMNDSIRDYILMQHKKYLDEKKEW